MEIILTVASLSAKTYPTFDTYGELTPEMLRRIVVAGARSGARLALVANHEGPEYFHVGFPDEQTQMRFYYALDHVPPLLDF